MDLCAPMPAAQAAASLSAERPRPSPDEGEAYQLPRRDVASGATGDEENAPRREGSDRTEGWKRLDGRREFVAVRVRV